MIQQSHYWAYTGENHNSKRHMYPMFIEALYNCQVMEATEMSINQLMDKEVVVHTHHGILLGHKKE